MHPRASIHDPHVATTLYVLRGFERGPARRDTLRCGITTDLAWRTGEHARSTFASRPETLVTLSGAYYDEQSLHALLSAERRGTTENFDVTPRALSLVAVLRREAPVSVLDLTPDRALWLWMLVRGLDASDVAARSGGVVCAEQVRRARRPAVGGRYAVTATTAEALERVTEGEVGAIGWGAVETDVAVTHDVSVAAVGPARECAP